MTIINLNGFDLNVNPELMIPFPIYSLIRFTFGGLGTIYLGLNHYIDAH